MSENKMCLVYSSGLSGLTEKNSSFDSGVLRVAYTGRNRNNSFISRETFERCIQSIYNCPIVCNYDRESDSIGSHDIDIVKDDSGNLRMVNVTVPCGVIPESANYWWEMIEDSGGIHEYLCIDVLLWKRQEVYRKLKEDGITDESMEITVKDGAMRDGVYVIRDFEFTAFCLLGSAEPCFEGASLELFSINEFAKQFDEMKRELKDCFSKNSEKGGNEALDQKKELITKYGLTADELDFDLEQISYEELEEGLKARFDETEETTEEQVDESGEEEANDSADDPKDDPAEAPSDDPKDEPTEDKPEEDDGDDDTAKRNSFGLLASQLIDELIEAVGVETVETAWGPMSRYCYIDYSVERSEVYAYDMNDWRLYGFTYEMNGDAVTIDFETKTRKKFDIVDFDGGEQTAAFARVYQNITEKFTAVNEELNGLRKFKHKAESAAENAEKELIMDRFADLNGLEAFENLRKDLESVSKEDLEEKCYAIRGRNTQVKFSAGETRQPKLKVGNINKEEAAYGGLFDKYGKHPKE